MRGKFWLFIHNTLESLWHWSYYHHLRHHEPRYKPPADMIYFETYRDKEVVIYRSEP